MEKLNLGCGKKIKKGYVNLDVVKLKGVDVVHDLNEYPWPFNKDEFGYVYCDNILEHLDSIVKPLEELHRITKKDGVIKVIVPLFPSVWSMIDPTHKVFYTFMTFDYFQENRGLNYYSKARFKILKKKIRFHPALRFLNPLVNIHERVQKFYYVFLSGALPPMFLDIELEVIK